MLISTFAFNIYLNIKSNEWFKYIKYEFTEYKNVNLFTILMIYYKILLLFFCIYI